MGEGENRRDLRPPGVRATVVHAGSAGSFHRHVELPAGSTLADAVRASGLLEMEPALAERPLDTGVFGRMRSPETELRDGDRVEVYRPLTIDPKEARRVRAEVRARGKRGGRGPR
jgi:uncharacterized protein